MQFENETIRQLKKKEISNKKKGTKISNNQYPIINWQTAGG
jgi:hypothetical protein